MLTQLNFDYLAQNIADQIDFGRSLLDPYMPKVVLGYDFNRISQVVAWGSLRE